MPATEANTKTDGQGRTRGKARRLRGLAVAATMAGLLAGLPARGLPLSTDPTRAGAAETAAPPMAPPERGTSPTAHMSALLQRTIFRFDVLTVEVRFDPETSKLLREVAGQTGGATENAISLAEVALQSRNVWSRAVFKRNVSFSDFLKGLQSGVGHALERGTLTPQRGAELNAELERTYSPLTERGIKKGDQLLWRIRGDALRLQVRTADGQLLVEQLANGDGWRTAVLHTYFGAPHDRFCRDLVSSVKWE